MTPDPLRPVRAFISDWACKYGVQEETIEAILVDFLAMVYFSVTGREPSDPLSDLRF